MYVYILKSEKYYVVDIYYVIYICIFFLGLILKPYHFYRYQTTIIIQLLFLFDIDISYFLVDFLKLSVSTLVYFFCAFYFYL